MSLHGKFFCIYIFILLILNKVSSHRIDEQRKEKVRNNTIINQTSNLAPRISPGKKWQVSRVTQKRYEIVNLLWKKTKIFGDVERIPQSANKKIVSKRKREHEQLVSQEAQRITLSLPYLRRSSSTPSFIEFNYLDLNDEVDSKNNFQSVNKSNNNHQRNKNLAVLNSPFFVFHLQYETCKSTETPTMSQPQPSYNNRTSKNLFLAYLTTSPRNLQSTEDDTTNNIDMETCPLTTFPSDTMNSSTNSAKSDNSHNDNVTRATTMYDKIKFFELYDKDTPTPLNSLKRTGNSNATYTQSIDYDQQIFFDDLDYKRSMRSNNNKSRFVKKHINRIGATENINEFYKSLSRSLHTETEKPTMRSVDDTEHYLTRQAAWSDFPFVAVYVYEPSQVLCDAAALSPHWLLAAASCLSRRYKDTFYVDAPSAYVAYCTDNWRYPERIAYVKQSFIHPQYDASDYTSRRLYNIGVIQIVNSMAETCNGWASISLISHQFDLDPRGTVGVAVGWGLDRYDASQPNINRSLMLYQNTVHSDLCYGYTKSKMKSYKNKVNDLYCLSLPNYSGETDDKVHGALLLIGGKLIALYLQEERRPSGEQSTQYTGVWRHIPWLLDTAREPEEFATFSLDF